MANDTASDSYHRKPIPMHEQQSPRREHYGGRSAHQGRKGCRLAPVRSAELLSCLFLSGGLRACWLACLPRPSSRAWTNYSSDEWICLPCACLPANRGVLAVLCLSCVLGLLLVVYGMARPRARFGRGCCVGLAQVEANPQRLLPFLSHSPFLPTFSHFVVCLATAQIASASTGPFSPSPSPLDRLISDIPPTLVTLPTSNTPSAPACKQQQELLLSALSSPIQRPATLECRALFLPDRLARVGLVHQLACLHCFTAAFYHHLLLNRHSSCSFALAFYTTSLIFPLYHLLGTIYPAALPWPCRQASETECRSTTPRRTTVPRPFPRRQHPRRMLASPQIPSASPVRTLQIRMFSLEVL
jgi:hypothetical protein